MNRWLLVIPPDGAAREVAQQAFGRLQHLLDDAAESFDTGKWQTGYQQLLRTPDEDLVTDLVCQSLLAKALSHRATHVLVCALAPITRHFLDLLRNAGMVTAHWFYEDYRVAKYWQGVLAGYHHWFAVQEGPMAQVCAVSGTRFHFLANGTSVEQCPNWLPLAARPHQVLFLGIPSSWRIRVLEHLVANGIKVSVAGLGWDKVSGPLATHVLASGWLDSKKAHQLYGHSRIVLNISTTEPADGGADHQLSPRAFDAVACGAHLITERTPLARRSLPGIPFDEYLGLKDLVDLVKLRLSTPLSEQDLQSHSRSILSHHSLLHRLQEILHLCDKRN